MASQPVFISSFPGYFTNYNIVDLPEGAVVTATNVSFSVQNLIEPRHGMPVYSAHEVDASHTATGTYFGLQPYILITSSQFNVNPSNSITITKHRFTEYDSLKTGNQTLPTGIAINTVYYVHVVDVNTIQLYTKPETISAGATLVTFTDTGSSGPFTFLWVQNYQNLDYFKTLTTETYVISETDSQGNYKFIELKPRDYTLAVSSSNFDQYRYIQSAGLPYVIQTPNLSNSPFSMPRYIQTDNGLYISHPRGWDVMRNSTFPTTSMSRVVAPTALVISAFLAGNRVSLLNSWLKADNSCDIVVTTVQTLANGAEIESAPSTPFTVKNSVGYPLKVTINVASSPTTVVRVYRTPMYAQSATTIGTDGQLTTTDPITAPVDYHQCVGDITTDSGGFGSAQLIFDDTVISSLGLPLLYTSASALTINSSNNQPPICFSATLFKNHGVFADVYTYPTAHLSLLSVDATTTPTTSALDTKVFTLGAQTFTFQNRDYTTSYNILTPTVPVEVNPPITLGDTSAARYGAGYGYFLYSAIANGYTAPGAGQASSTVRVGVSSFDSSPDLDSSVFALTGTNLAVTINPTDSDPTKFPTSGGYFYYTYADNTTKAGIIRYVSSVQTDATTYTFNNIQTILGDAPVAGTHNIYIWYVPSASGFDVDPQTLPVTAPFFFPLYVGNAQIGATDIGAGTLGLPAYLSLVPSKQRPSNPIAILSTLTGSSVSTDAYNAMRVLNVEPYYTGASDRSVSERIDQTSKNLIASINANSNTRTIYRAVADPSLAAYFYIEALTFSAITVNVSSGIENKFEPALSTSPTDITDSGLRSRIKNGLMFSKLGFPDTVSNAFFLTPVLVGSSANRIIGLAATRDNLYIFKEREGIFRLSMQSGVAQFPDPIIQEVMQLDTTVLPVASESIQVLDNVVYFLSDRGFHRIVDNQVQFISNAIQQDVKTALARTPTYEGIRSSGDRTKNLYTCWMPSCNDDRSGTGFAYNYQTGIWSLNSQGFDAAVQDKIGRITTLVSDPFLNYQTTGSTTPPIDFNEAYTPIDSTQPWLGRTWQYLRQEQFTGVYKNVVVGQNNVYTTNVVDSSADQYDEWFRPLNLNNSGGFTAVITDNTAVLTIDKTVVPYRPDGYFTDLLTRMKTKQLYVSVIDLHQGNPNNADFKIPVQMVTASESSTESSLTVSWDTKYSVPQITGLEVGVNTFLEFVLYKGVNAITLKQFSRYGAHYQDRSEPFGLPSTLDFSFAVDNQTAFSTPITFSTVVAARTLFETLVPLTAARGRYLRVLIKHNKPEENFLLNGHTLVYRETASTKVTFK